MSTDIKRVSPTDAKKLVDEEGYVYVDVRSVPEFTEEHPQGALNVPLMNMGPGGMTPNADFVAVMRATFAPETKLVLGCKGGGRSLRAAGVLAQQGFTNLIDQRAGFSGAHDPFGTVTEAGWKGASLPTDRGDGGERSYAPLAKKKK